MASVEEFDTVTRRWSAARPLPLAVGAPSGVTIAGSMLVSGGGDDGGGWVTPTTWLRRVDGSWRRMPDLIAARHGHGMAALGGSAYVFGGAPCAGYGSTGSIERLRVGDVPN